jgi:carboxymethylenebutenolidase
MEFKSEAEALVHLYIDGAFNRRELVKRLTKSTGSVAAAMAAMAALDVPAEAQVPAACLANVRVPDNAPDVDIYNVDFPGEAGTLFGYWTRPKPMPESPMAAVLVIHENRGLTDYIKDVTRRIARAGYVGLAIDLLSRQGGTARFPDPVEAGNAYNRTRPAENTADMMSAIAWLKTLDYVAPSRIGVIGFCAGGGNVMNLVVATKDPGAAVAFYPGSLPSAQDLTDKLTTPVMFNLGQSDTAVTNRVAAVLPAMLAANKRWAMHVYDGSRHAFHNDTGAAYDSASACDAWNQTLSFLGKYLRPAPTA